MTEKAPFYAPDNTGAEFGPRAPWPGERFWTMIKNGHTCHAELRAIAGGDMVELQIYADDEFRLGHVHVSRGWAVTEAPLKQETLRIRGWTAATDQFERPA